MSKKLSELRHAISKAYRMDETTCVESLLQQAELPTNLLSNIEHNARELVHRIRQSSGSSAADFIARFDLSTDEGVALMCLAEALLRIPDAQTKDALIQDKLSDKQWCDQVADHDSSYMNTAVWGLMLTGKFFAVPASPIKKTCKRLMQRMGEPVIRLAVTQAVKMLSEQFIMASTIDKALANQDAAYRYSFDMLGEAACTKKDAKDYSHAYAQAIQSLSTLQLELTWLERPGISVKLSALHPRFEFAKRDLMLPQLIASVKSLASLARDAGISFTIDAEEAARLDITLDVIEAIVLSPEDMWEGFGVVVQAYAKRATYVIDCLSALAEQAKQKICVRLVKGAYWDTEIKWAQQFGLEGYPVFTRKAATDVSYIACVKKIAEAKHTLFGQFATHNAYTIAVVMSLMQGRTDFEFQCLHGMGAPIYQHLIAEYPCRVYAPVGDQEALLPYLVRRILENGANTSFVHHIADQQYPLERLLINPVALMQQVMQKPHPQIPLPEAIYGKSRKNAMGLDLTDRLVVDKLYAEINNARTFLKHQKNSADVAVEDVVHAIKRADRATFAWLNTSVNQRAACLVSMADLLQQHQVELLTLLIDEAGKTMPDAIAEIREAIDYCRYYAMQAKHICVVKKLSGITGEQNTLQLQGKGVAACISPWNFPLAIFLGQVVAALVTGNTVIAKPAEATPFIAKYTVDLLYQAGVPQEVLHLLFGKGRVIGDALVAHPAVKAVLFTGSTNTAKHIERTLAERDGDIVSLIAETGGQNVMIADSSSLPEQLVVDVMQSAFGSAGQRCSALRVLYIQDDIADRFIALLTGAMSELVVGNPALLTTDVGPVIDDSALTQLNNHIKWLSSHAKFVASSPLPTDLSGTYFAPHAFEIQCITQLLGEVFGPILHIVRYAAGDLGTVIENINSVGFGLTCGIHSRIESTIDFVQSKINVGNIYVNRNMVGAVVGCQPFGGRGLSGTGPKAGGPNYLPRLCNEKTVSVNTTAMGGNLALASLHD